MHIKSKKITILIKTQRVQRDGTCWGKVKENPPKAKWIGLDRIVLYCIVQLVVRRTDIINNIMSSRRISFPYSTILFLLINPELKHCVSFSP